MEYELLKSLVIIFGVSAMVVFLLHGLKIPSLAGFLIAGALIGPYGLGMIKDAHSVEMLAEIGVVLLLFTIGIELSISNLARMRKAVIAGGGAQVSLTIALSAVVLYLATGDASRSVFLGFLVALSSTAIVMKALSDKGEIDSPHGRTMMGILIFQDLCVVPLMLFIPLLSGGEISIMGFILKIGKAALIIALVLLSAGWLVPAMLRQIVHTRSRELFIITIILLFLGTALLTSMFGLSLALGAFLAGLILSKSEYAHQATSDILPFKESFMSLFFVSIGMLMNTGYMAGNCSRIATTVALIFGLKIITGIVSAVIAGNPFRTSIHAGLGLAQIGEFSFVLAMAGKAAGLMTDDFYQIFISSSVVTMIITPFVLKAAPSISGWLASRHLMKKVERLKKAFSPDGYPRRRRDHVIIIGFGLNGRNLARVLKEADIPYVVLEMNSDTVTEMRKKGEPIYYGDGTSAEILHKMGIEKARLMVAAISDPAATRRIVSVARHKNPDIYIIVRTRYLAEVDDLRSLGAEEVIPEEFETSIEIFSRVLHKYNFPNNVILDMVDKIRRDNYTALRGIEFPKRHLFEKCEWLPEIEMDGYKTPDNSHLAGKSIAELQVRKKTGATIIAVRRGAEVFTNPSPDFRFKAGDIILFTGERESMNTAINYFKKKDDAAMRGIGKDI
jgi:CPA2 family monovalent cation:H+ antiporter-2